MATAQDETSPVETAGRRPGRLFWWLGGLAAVFAMAWWQATRPIAYTRYVSPPFADGTRETFLYPSALGQVRTYSFPMHGVGGKAYSYQSVVVMRSLGPMERLLWQTRFLRGMLHPDEFEMVLVSRSEGPVPPVVLGGQGRYARTDETVATPNGSSHSVIVTDRRSGVCYRFSHHGNGRGLSRRFAQDDAAISGSFQVLSPGEAPPRL